MNPDTPHSFERLSGTDSCSVCGKLEAEHVFRVYDITDPTRPEYAPRLPQIEIPSDQWPPSLEDLIDRVALTQEAMQLDQVPLLERVKVLALLKQAQALERIAAALENRKERDVLLDSL